MTPDRIDGMEVGLFWVLAVVAVAGALGLLFARKAVHAAMAMAMTMISLGVIYIVQQAEFVGIIQIFVYSGAVMMLFLFVVMLVGVDASDSTVETLPLQRVLAFGLGALFVAAAVYGLTRVTWPAAVGLSTVQAEGTVTALAREIFERQVLTFETLGALLVIAVMGAMVLAHRERLTPKRTQRQLSQERLRTGEWLAGKPNPGVYARHNAADTPALAPDGSPVEESVPRVLVARGQVTNPGSYRLPAGSGRADGQPPAEQSREDLPTGTNAATDNEMTKQEGPAQPDDTAPGPEAGRGERSDGEER
ncbi:NADH-quinone oxidoreductase subunit J [Serinicoccus chungangensis]|uniref:NADH-quinone oxidoreductase subunit J n=1 Tax=Serinicoccus chungangensis TaxID=767452 RepID=UPI0009FA4994|nr:NADH-quinone oxidoreductase subunit J [Serinicoccus chungangensis]